METIRKLNDGLFVHLSNDAYDLNIILKRSVAFKITSQEKISFYGELLSLKKDFMQDNTIVSHHYLIIVDVNLVWSIYRIKTILQQPQILYNGTLISEQYDLNKLINLHQIDGKIVFVMAGFKLLYVALPQYSQLNQNYLFSKEYIPYGNEPDFQHGQFSLKQDFLLKGGQYQLQQSYYHIMNQKTGILFLVFRSSSNNLYFVYTLQYLRKTAYFISSNSILYNIEDQILGLWPTQHPEYFIIQTTQNLIIWNIGQLKSQQDQRVISEIKFRSNIVQVVKNGHLMYIGVTHSNQFMFVKFDTKSVSIQLQKWQIAEQPTNIQILQIYPNMKSDQYYLLTTKQQFMFVSKKGQQNIIYNQYTKILEARLQTSSFYNFLIIKRLRGKQQEKIIYGNHFFAYDLEHYMHGLMINMGQNLLVENNLQNIVVWISSPVIGLKKMLIAATKKSDKPAKKPNSSTIKSQQAQALTRGMDYQIVIDKNIKHLCEQTLFLNAKYQITAQEIIQLHKISTKISKLFDDATDYISKALVIADLILLVISQQIHIFDSKLARKYIYCCNIEIKNIYALNDYNVIAIQLFENSLDSQYNNQLVIIILEQQKATKLKNVAIQQNCKPIKLSTLLNTAEYKLTLFGNKIVISSNDSLHRYQIQKITVEQFQLPLPPSNLANLQITPYYPFSKQKNSTEFIVIYREEDADCQKQYENVQFYFGSFTPKYLFKKLDFGSITVSYQRVLTLSQLPKDKLLFAVGVSSSTKNVSNYETILLIGEKFLSVCGIKFGKLQLQWLQDRSYIEEELAKVQSFPNQLLSQISTLQIEKPIRMVATLKKQYIIVHNSRQIYYASRNSSKIQLISYYSLMNDDFVSFRNNLNVNQIGDQAYMNIFNQKMVIRDVKYINDRTIFVLYSTCIVVLEVGYNSSLVVRQELKFKSNDPADFIQIEELLQNYDQESIYLRQKNGRIFVLKKVGESYEIVFHSFMDQDVLLFSRLRDWNRRQRTFNLRGTEDDTKTYEQLVLKKDGQLIVKQLQDKAEEENKLVYI